MGGKRRGPRRGYAILGIVTLALVSATGGGLLRDGLFIQDGPPALVRTPTCLLLIAGDDLRIAGGILLFAASRDMIGQFNRPGPPAPTTHPAVTPLAVPIIITPWGVVAILIFMGVAAGNHQLIALVIGFIVLIMALNLIGTLLARQILALLGFVTFQIVGWVFAVLQAGLAVDAVVSSLRNLGPFRLNS